MIDVIAPGPATSDGQWKDRDIGFRLLGLGGCRRPDAAMAREYHVDRKQEQ
jgi:hypothetical protein